MYVGLQILMGIYWVCPVSVLSQVSLFSVWRAYGEGWVHVGVVSLVCVVH